MSNVVTIGDATLYHGDCLEILPMLARCSSLCHEDEPCTIGGCAKIKIDAVVTDPPYGIGFDYIGYDDTKENLERLINGFLPISRKMSKRCIVTPGNTNLAKYPPADWNACWTWDTTTACGALGWSQWQPILFYGEDVSKGTKNWSGKLKTDRIHFSGGQAKIDGSDIAYKHSCPKPEEFMRRLLDRFSKHGETVCDPFMGSGTTGVACANLGRKFVGIEIERKYFDIACERIEAAYSQGRLFA